MADDQNQDTQMSRMRETQNKTFASTMSACHGIDEKDNQVIFRNSPIEKSNFEKNFRIEFNQKEHCQNFVKINETG